MENCKSMEENDSSFHYSWFLILMVFVTWREPKYMQFLTVRGECCRVHYMNLSTNTNLERECINNQVFYTYYQQLSTLIASKPRNTKELIDLYKTKIKFMDNMHQVYIKP